MSFLVIPNMRVSGANMQHSSFLLGGPPVLPAYFFGHALGRKLCAAAGRVTLIHHYSQPQGQIFYGSFSPQQRKGASYTFGSRRRDYSKDSMSLSLQPIASSNIGVSIILEINGLRSIDGVSKFLYSARFSGGSITSTGAPRLFEDFDDAFSAILSGFVVIDRRDLLATKDGKDPAELFVDALGRSENSQSDNTWLSGACVGYACLSPFETRIAAREGYKHAFVEPLIGLVQYKSLRSIAKPGELLLWEPEWSDAGVFRVYQR